MDAEAAIARDFADLGWLGLGVLLFGSHATGRAHPGSDIDVCLVAGPEASAIELQHQAWRIAGPYDVRVFEDLPLWMQGEVLETGKVVLARDPVSLHDYLRPKWKQWQDQRRRVRLSPAEMEYLLQRREAARP
jgi:uncharacterized protein